MNLNVNICHPDSTPKYLQCFLGANKIYNFEENQKETSRLLLEADLIFSLDYNEPKRLGEEMAIVFNESKASKIMIDHHLHPADFTEITISNTEACSTCELIYDLIQNSGNIELLDSEIGTALYLGIMTDTGSFRFNSVKSKTHRIIADLIEVGVKNDEIHEKVFDVNTVDKLKLKGFATSQKLQVLPEFHTAFISLTEEELNQFEYEKGDTEGLVNVALSIVGVKIAAFFSEKDGMIKISFRSKGRENPINLLASENFEGGGHANASGGKFDGNMEDALKKFISVLPKYVS